MNVRIKKVQGPNRKFQGLQKKKDKKENDEDRVIGLDKKDRVLGVQQKDKKRETKLH